MAEKGVVVEEIPENAIEAIRVVAEITRETAEAVGIPGFVGEPKQPVSMDVCRLRSDTILNLEKSYEYS